MLRETSYNITFFYSSVVFSLIINSIWNMRYDSSQLENGQIKKSQFKSNDEKGEMWERENRIDKNGVNRNTVYQPHLF